MTRGRLVYSTDEPPLRVHDEAYPSAGDGYIAYSKDDFCGFTDDSVKKINLEISFNRLGFVGYTVFQSLSRPDLIRDDYLGIGKVGGSFSPHVFITNHKIPWERRDKRITSKESGHILAQKYVNNNSQQSKIELLFDVEKDAFTHITINGYGFDFTDYPFKKVWLKIPWRQNYNSRHKSIWLIY